MTGTERPAGEKEMKGDTRRQTGAIGPQEEGAPTSDENSSAQLINT